MTMKHRDKAIDLLRWRKADYGLDFDLHCLPCHLCHARIVVTTKAPIVMAMKMRSATGPNILNTPKQISPQAKTKSIELSPRSA
jgi:hypothetical protein